MNMVQAQILGPLQVFKCARNPIRYAVVVPEDRSIDSHEPHCGYGIDARVIVSMRAVDEDQARLAVMVRPIERRRIAE